MSLPHDQVPIICPSHGAVEAHAASGPPWYCPTCRTDCPVDVPRREEQQAALATQPG